MSEQRQCAQHVFSGGRWDYRGHACGNPATIEHGGKWWCHLHDPGHKELKKALSAAKYRMESADFAVRNALSRAGNALFKRALAADDHTAALTAEELAAIDDARCALGKAQKEQADAQAALAAYQAKRRAAKRKT